MPGDGHVVGDVDLLNDKIGKVWDDGHKLLWDQENGAPEIFGCFFSIPPFASASPRENHDMVHRRIWSPKQR